jgi:hypothetical protein
VALIIEIAMLAEYVTVANPNVAGQKVAVFAIMFFVFFYGLFIDAASFIYSSEIYPTNIRSRGMALSTVTYFTACIVSSGHLKFITFLTNTIRLTLHLEQRPLPTLAGDTTSSSCA